MFKSKFIRNGNNYDMHEASLESGLITDTPSLTQQSQGAEADINTIVKRFGLTGQLPSGVRAPTYGDFSGVDDYRTALDSIREAEASFMRMPAEVRKRFEHDPQKFVEFCSDEKNLDEMRKLGLAKPAPKADNPPEPAK